MTKLKALLSIGGISGLLGLSALWEQLIQALGLPADIITLPVPLRIVVVVAAVVFAVYSAHRTSETNPDGTPATESYRPE